jgi:hypothetical protein
MTIFQAFTNFLWIPLAHDVAYDNASTITRDMETQSTEYPLDTIANPVHLI